MVCVGLRLILLVCVGIGSLERSLEMNYFEKRLNEALGTRFPSGAKSAVVALRAAFDVIASGGDGGYRAWDRVDQAVSQLEATIPQDKNVLALRELLEAIASGGLGGYRANDMLEQHIAQLELGIGQV